MVLSGTAESDVHPAPHRGRVRLIALLFAVLAPPLAWSLHLIANYAFSSHACFPGHSPRAAPLPDLHWLRGLLIAVDLVSMAISILALLVALNSWRATSQEMAETGPPLVEIGEGRTRFLAIWGVIISLGFFVAVFFDFVGLWILPPCG
jgi:hypothetical protein